ncbi:hypothetical protein D3C71_1823250 [compost metagenome]
MLPVKSKNLIELQNVMETIPTLLYLTSEMKTKCKYDYNIGEQSHWIRITEEKTFGLVISIHIYQDKTIMCHYNPKFTEINMPLELKNHKHIWEYTYKKEATIEFYLKDEQEILEIIKRLIPYL